MPYVSAQYAPPLPPEMMALSKVGDPRRVIATDDQGVEWHLTEDSQVGDWLRFMEGGGTVLAFEPDIKGEVTPAKKVAARKAKETRK
jgi:hypothetical protein